MKKEKKNTKRHLNVKRSKNLFSTSYFNDHYQKTLKMSSFETNEQNKNKLGHDEDVVVRCPITVNL